MRKLFFWIPVIAGTAATLLMMRRGQSFGNSAKAAFARPVRTFVQEIRNA